jgi:hypothetical protein
MPNRPARFTAGTAKPSTAGLSIVVSVEMVEEFQSGLANLFVPFTGRHSQMEPSRRVFAYVRAIVVVSHDRARLASLADRLVRLTGEVLTEE